MDPFFTEEQLNNMSRENMMEVMRIMQNQIQKKETEVQLLKDKQKELEFMNAMLSDRLALAQRRRFGSSSEKYADGYEQMDLFNEAEVNADMDTAEIEEEIVIPSHKRKKRTGKKEEEDVYKRQGIYSQDGKYGLNACFFTLISSFTSLIYVHCFIKQITGC